MTCAADLGGHVGWQKPVAHRLRVGLLVGHGLEDLKVHLKAASGDQIVECAVLTN
jgi:hypothetical protein